MDLTPLKEKLGDDYARLEAHVAALISQRDEARRESADGRKTLKAEVQALKDFKARAFEKLGLETEDDLDALTGKPAAAEMEKQYQAKLRRLDADLKDRDAKLADLEGRWRKEMASSVIGQAIEKHPFVDADVARLLVGSRIEFEGDAVFYKTDDGRLIPVDEGAALVAKSKPHLLKAQGAGGSGAPAGGSGGVVKNPWSKEHFNLTEQGRITSENPQHAAQLMAAAT